MTRAKDRAPFIGPNRTHGLRATYQDGCRCEACREASRNYDRKRAEAGPRRQRDNPTSRRNDWLERAACKEMDPDLFFLEARFASQMEPRLRTVCGGCPVRRDCLDDVLHFESFHGDTMREGFQGGMSAAERAVEARKRAGMPRKARAAFRQLRAHLG